MSAEVGLIYQCSEISLIALKANEFYTRAVELQPTWATLNLLYLRVCARRVLRRGFPCPRSYPHIPSAKYRLAYSQIILNRLIFFSKDEAYSKYMQFHLICPYYIDFK